MDTNNANKAKLHHQDGNPEQLHSALPSEGTFVHIDSERFYQIRNYDSMLPFFISIASDSNHWMYISSTGGLTLGRRNPDLSLFPYYTDDKITESAEVTGSKTIFQIKKGGKTEIWEPFSERQAAQYCVERTIAKNLTGNKLLFTEKNFDLGLSFSYCWMNSDRFGWVKKSILTNDTAQSQELYVVDGLQNLLPAGIDRQTQNVYSTLADAYKKTELIPHCGLALLRMESILVDRAEPSEALRVNTVWTHGLKNAHYLLSSSQLKKIRAGAKPHSESESKGVRGAFFTCAQLQIDAHQSNHWYFVAEVNQDSAQVNNLIDLIENSTNLEELLELDIKKGTEALRTIVGQADGIQQTADEHNVARHFANVLFNVMRGGIYSDGYTINSLFFQQHVEHFNKEVWSRQRLLFSSLPPTLSYTELQQIVVQANDSQLLRLFYEYLPITFSRRHGDPSRPWNSFDINIKDEKGQKRLSYQGNWRDIFQNWEALSLSFPAYIFGIIAKFLNATTVDGYNAYRITNKGIEWEEIEPDNPWSNIGYWGDHQIVYLQKLLELAQHYFPTGFADFTNSTIFAYAQVPYRIKAYADIVKNPKDTILFDHTLNKQLCENEQRLGADAKLIHTKSGEPLLVSFTEKVFASLLSKLSNFIPQAGIWLNTQRPEWNDANNALVGTGASMVTVYYMRRFVSFLKQHYATSANSSYLISSEMADFMDGVYTTFKHHQAILEDDCTDSIRREFTDRMGRAGEKFRSSVYHGFNGNSQKITVEYINEFLDLTLSFIDHSIESNKRPDKLYHAYNLVKFSDSSLQIRTLYEMLEGQVAVLSSGKLTTDEVLEVLEALRQSALYRPDQDSYILYPNKSLPDFLHKNNINAREVNRNRLFKEFLGRGDQRIINADLKGKFHFNASFNNVGFLHQALVQLQTEGVYEIDDQDIQDIEDIYEHIFDHQSFTGRSGTFYKYEGLGSIYWHMVSKLLLSIAENIHLAEQLPVDKEKIKMLEHYFEAVKEGIGAHKSPAEYGSFPFDAYSHTPIMAGVQQPGMTGQVKEDIITRFFELGLQVKNGCLHIEPKRIPIHELIKQETLSNCPYLCFTYCGVEFRYQKNTPHGVELHDAKGQVFKSADYKLSEIQTKELFLRTNSITKIVVNY